MIQLYSSTNTNYNFNGNFVLSPTSCTLKATLKGAWELELTHPIVKTDLGDDVSNYVLADSDGSFIVDSDDYCLSVNDIVTEIEENAWSSILEGCVLAVPTFMGKKQLFRIYEVARTETEVTVHARPIFFDSARDVFILDRRPISKNGQQTLDYMMDGTIYSGESDITKVLSAEYIRKNLIDILCGSDENSFINRWGGEPLYDNYHIIFNERAGADRGLEILYGKNIEGINQTINIDELITRIVPIAFNGRMISGSVPYVDSPLINDYPIIFTKLVKYESIKLAEDLTTGEDTTNLIVCYSQQELDEALTVAAYADYVLGCDKPKVSLDIDMIDLSSTDEYSQYQNLELVRLGDTVHCRHRLLGIESTSRVIEIEWDCIRDRIEHVTLGEPQYDYFRQLTERVNTIGDVVNSKGEVMADRVAGFLDLMKTKLGHQQRVAEHQVVRSIIFEDFDPDSPTYGALCIGTQGIEIADQRTQDGTDWDWKAAMDSHTIHAERMITGILSDKYGTNYWNLDTGDFRLASNAFSVDGTPIEDYVLDLASQTSSLVMYLSNEFQGVVPDESGVIDCQTTVTVYFGTHDATSECTYQVEVSPGVTGSWNGTTKTYTATKLINDTGTIRITATYQNTISVSKTFSLARINQAETSRVYILDLSDTVLRVINGKTGALNKAFIGAATYYTEGSSVTRQNYPARIKIEAYDGSSYTQVYASSSNESSVTYSLPADAGKTIKEYRVKMYASDGFDFLLDSQSIPIIREAAALTPDEAINILTDGGAIKGIFKQGNQLYINADYIRTGILAGPNDMNYWNLETGEFRLGPGTQIVNGSDSDTIGAMQTRIGQNASGISAEETRARAEELRISNVTIENGQAISDEEARAKAAEAANSSAISSEETRAKNAENKLTGDLENLRTSVTQEISQSEGRVTTMVSQQYATKTELTSESSRVLTAAEQDAAEKADVAERSAKAHAEAAAKQSVGGNILDYTTCTIGKWIYNDGTIASSSYWAVSDFIPITESGDFIFTYNSPSSMAHYSRVTFYNADKEAIGGLPNSSTNAYDYKSSALSYSVTYPVPETAAYVRVSFRPGSASSISSVTFCRISAVQTLTEKTDDLETQLASAEATAKAETEEARAYAEAAANQSVGDNVLDDTTCTYGKRVNNDGTLTGMSYYAASDFIKIAKAGDYILTVSNEEPNRPHRSRITFYNAQKQAIGGYPDGSNTAEDYDNVSKMIYTKTYTIPETAAYVRVSFACSSSTMVQDAGVTFCRKSAVQDAIDTAAADATAKANAAQTNAEANAAADATAKANAAEEAAKADTDVKLANYTKTVDINSMFEQTSSEFRMYTEAITRQAVGENEIDRSKWTTGKRIYNDGTVSSISSWAVSDYIRTVEHGDYTLVLRTASATSIHYSRVTFYDENKQAIGGLPNTANDACDYDGSSIKEYVKTYTIPETVAYVRVSFRPYSGEVIFGRATKIQELENRQTEFTVSLDGVSSIVSTKTDATQVESIIDQKADSIRLKASEISWESDGSTMSSKGILTLKPAVIRYHTLRLAGGVIWFLYGDDPSNYTGIGMLNPITFTSWNARGVSMWAPKGSYVSMDYGATASSRTMGLIVQNEVSGANVSEPIVSYSSCRLGISGHVATGALDAWSLTVSHTKNRVTDTKHYGRRLFYSYETSTPYFGDIGTGKTDENGLCYVEIDDIFAEGVEIESEYVVFLQKEGPGDIWIEEKAATYFLVKGTPNLAFGWELKAVQKGYSTYRTEEHDGLEPDNPEQFDDELDNPARIDTEDHTDPDDDMLDDAYNEDFMYEEAMEDIYDY